MSAENPTDQVGARQESLDAIQMYIENWADSGTEQELPPVFSREEVPLLGTGLNIQFPPGDTSLKTAQMLQNVAALYNAKVIKKTTGDNSWLVVPVEKTSPF